MTGVVVAPISLPMALFRILSLVGVLIGGTAAVAWAADSSAAAGRDLEVTHRYLNLPVKTGAAKRVVSVLVAGIKVREFSIELAEDAVDFWVSLEVGEWRGKLLRLQVDDPPAGSRGLERVEQGDTLQDGAGVYGEPLRPLVHFSSRRGWLNDPNGLVHFEGTYHLFYQHNPFGWGHGNMTWGHATSTDLLRWEERGDALHPDAMGTMYSGSGVVDRQNTSGFGVGTKPPLVLVYTAAGGTNAWSKEQPFTQCLAFSTDGGGTWTKYAGNPVLAQRAPGNRDPKVFWHAPTRRWIMVLYVGYPKVGEVDARGRPAVTHAIEFFSSPNLREWTYLSRNDGFYECPDFFELPVNGDVRESYWVLQGANTDYQVGTFNGTTFTPVTPILKGHLGNALYAPQTFSDMPDGRRVQIGWGRVPMPGMPFNQQMLMPCGLTLRATPEGPRLAWQPVREVATLRSRDFSLAPRLVSPAENPLRAARARAFDLEVELEVGEASEITFVLHGVPVVYHVARKELTVEKITVPVPSDAGRIRLRVLGDRQTLQLFALGGLVYLPVRVPIHPENQEFELSVRGGPIRLRSLQLSDLNPIWANAVPPAAP